MGSRADVPEGQAVGAAIPYSALANMVRSSCHTRGQAAVTVAALQSKPTALCSQ